MADWKKFANLLGMAQYGDDVRAAKERKRKEGIEAEELGFRRSANSRAEAEAGRESEKFGFEKSTWDSTRKQLEQKVKSGELSLQEAQNKLDEYQAAGGAEGAGQRVVEDQGFQRDENRRAGARLGLDQKRDQREAELQGERKRGAQLGNDYEEATLQARIDEKNDPMVRDSQLLASVAQALNSAIRAGDQKRADELQQDYTVLRSELLKKKALGEAKRQSVSRQKGPVQGSPYDVFK